MFIYGISQVKVNLGGRAYMDEDGNIVPGKQLDMVVDGDDVYIVGCRFTPYLKNDTNVGLG